MFIKFERSGEIIVSFQFFKKLNLPDKDFFLLKLYFDSLPKQNLCNVSKHYLKCLTTIKIHNGQFDCQYLLNVY